MKQTLVHERLCNETARLLASAAPLENCKENDPFRHYTTDIVAEIFCEVQSWICVGQSSWSEWLSCFEIYGKHFYWKRIPEKVSSEYKLLLQQDV